MDNDKWLKGDAFQNRYRITGTLTTVSPLHIGAGEESDARLSEAEKKRHEEKKEKVPGVSLVMKEADGKPVIPGSALKGVLRHWLLSVLAGIDTKWATMDGYAALNMNDLSQADQIKEIKSKFSWLDILFGTPYSEGKVEAWDATCATTKSPSVPDTLLSWNDTSLTYVDTSVAIDPETRTAAQHLLYKYEVVPPGVKFELNLVGQNLSDLELGLVLLALQGFNSKIYPVCVGARGGRGYGRMSFMPGDVYCLPRSRLAEWIKKTTDAYATAPSDDKDAAGWYSLDKLDAAEQAKRIADVKQALKTGLGG